MNVIEAINELKKNSLVRCPSVKDEYGRKQWLTKKPGTNEIWLCAVNEEGHWPLYVYCLSSKDVLSTKWVKHKNKSKVCD